MARWGKISLTIVGFMACILLIIVIGAYNYNIIEEEYDKLTITKMDKTAAIITEKSQIESIIDRINDSPRKFMRRTGFTYDYLPYGFLIFENKKEKVEHVFYIFKGNTVIGYWDIDTRFEFAKDLE
ncbi:hypothetical protein DRW41_08055 [Neobacillus piezotolerans]|uniref:Uncharacterized protein n=1 Tax=Neobacillus piezotolerans TaxID=2259171 RepID=A0A3D8GTQ9_9BACI|nr:hypothetical protein [Neobacillus piezotolerans]RDU37767.1 hypothetical protein DRW41_08055 [Neobacillus piezotolerans]